MAHKTEWLTFCIVLTDAALVKQYQAQYPEGVNRAIYNPANNGGASIEFGAPFRGYTQPNTGAPYSWTPHSGLGTQGGPYPLDVATFQRTSGGFWGIGGTTTRYLWLGQFVLAGTSSPTDAGAVPVYENIKPARLMDGFELGVGGLGHGVAGTAFISREASRHTGGFGLALRGSVSETTSPLATYGAAASATGWDRIYVRLRKTPVDPCVFWRTKGSTFPAAGVALGVNAAGQLLIVSVASGGTGTIIQAIDHADFHVWSGLASDQAWVRLDCMTSYSTSATGTFALYIKGALVANVSVSGLGGSGGANNFISVNFGNAVFNTANRMEIDVDDWIHRQLPTNPTKQRDFLNGSKIVRIRPKAFAASHGAGWTGDLRALLQLPFFSGTYAELSSVTSGGVAAVTTDDDQYLDGDKAAVGVGALMVSVRGTRAAGALTSAVGYSLKAAAFVMTNITMGTTPSFFSALFTGPAGPNYDDVTPIELKFIKTADINSGTVSHLCAQVELQGIFGPEDVRLSEVAGVAPTFPKYLGEHNAPWDRTPWAIDGAAPANAPFIVKAGTYVGNGTAQDLDFRAPVHLLFIRPLTAGLGGFSWFSPDGNSHEKLLAPALPAIANAAEDLSFVPVGGPDQQQNRYRFAIAGANTQINANAVTYQYIAIMDPGSRFCLNGRFTHKNTLAEDATNGLIKAGFTPEMVLFMFETWGGGASVGLYAKGPGNGTTDMSYYAGGVVATACALGAGSITTKTAFHSLWSTAMASFSAWRKADGNNDPGQNGVVAIIGWTGDGTASRTIALPASGRRPLFALAFSEAATGYWRDPSHTGSNSTNSSGTDLTTGITGGGVDSISVGSTLNTNAVKYNLIVWFADATAGNNGWGVNGEFEPVEAASATDGPGTGFAGSATEPTDATAAASTVTAPTDSPPIIADDITTDLAAACLSFTTAICNVALARIGCSKKIANLSTDLTLEAEQARLHYGLEVGQALRDFPWPFATRYANLVLVAGTATVPVNTDWQYSYRVPTNMLFARRIVGQADQRRAYDQDPIPFRIGSDATGQLIYTDAVATATVPVVLEYTLRLDCPASAGDPLFRSAVAWRLAAAFAPVIARSEDRAKFCLGMYGNVLVAAETAGASEAQQEPPGDADWIAGRN